MGMRFRRSIKLGPGLRVNVGKRSLGLSAGVRGARYSVNTSGRTTQSVGVPGTGLSYVSSKGGGGGTRRTASKPSPAAPSPGLPRPGLLAPQTEKRFYEGVQAYLKGDAAKALTAFEQASAKDDKNISDDLFAGLSAIMLGANEKARGYLEHVVSSDIELPDKLLQKYLPPDRAAIRLSVDITPRVEAQVPFSSLGAALSLAELYQAEGRLEDAIGLLQQLAEAAPNNSELKLSLCDLLYEDGDDESVVEVSNGADNDSIVGLAILHLRAKALARRGLNDAAGETFTACLKKTAGRDPEFLKEIRYDRAAFYAETNQAAKARKEFEKLYAEDSQYLDVAHRVSG